MSDANFSLLHSYTLTEKDMESIIAYKETDRVEKHIDIIKEEEKSEYKVQCGLYYLPIPDTMLDFSREGLIMLGKKMELKSIKDNYVGDTGPAFSVKSHMTLLCNDDDMGFESPFLMNYAIVTIENKVAEIFKPYNYIGAPLRVDIKHFEKFKITLNIPISAAQFDDTKRFVKEKVEVGKEEGVEEEGVKEEGVEEEAKDDVGKGTGDAGVVKEEVKPA